jgi:hypothetical protein
LGSFPIADPIPLPAPVWLMKLLSLLTLGLHFSAVMILVGCLMLVIILNFRGRYGKKLELVQASYTIAKQLPVTMTFVINLGVPPLLFLQVLYGQQIYSSSVLIGVMWISVIFLLMLAYWLMYRTVVAIETSKTAWGIALLALLVVMGIGQIYSMNMTLMLRPEVWNEMYANSPSGLQAPKGDPTTTARWLFVMAGGPLMGGLWVTLLSCFNHLRDEVKTVMRKSGAVMAIIGGAVMLFCGYRVMSLQPEAVTTGIAGMPLYSISLLLCAATMLLATVIGVVQFAAKKSSGLVGTLGVLFAFLAAATAGVVRDGIRDFALKTKGFDVYAVEVFPNWSVLVAFFLLFVIMLATVVWLLMVMKQAAPPKEEVAL